MVLYIDTTWHHWRPQIKIGPLLGKLEGKGIKK